MNKNDLLKWINAFTTDIEYTFNGKRGVIIPLSNRKGKENITLCYGDEDVILKTADEVMAYPLFDGKSFNDISEKMVFG